MARFKALCLQFTVFLLIFTVSPVYPQQIEYLQKEDVNRVMNQIFDRHINKKEMTEEILKNSLRLYVDQFDPRHIYLLQSEVEPFLNPSEEEIEQYLTNYKKHNFTTFRKIDELVANAIDRQRGIRKSLMSDPDPLFRDRLGPDYYDSLSQRNDFAASAGELKQRVRDDIMDFIEHQRDRFGAEAVSRSRQHVLDRYDNLQKDWESGYLYVDNHERPLPPQQREHQFTLHVLKALSRSLDSHTSVINDSEAYNMRSRLLKGHPGTGIAFEDKLEGIAVKKIQSGTPAERAGKITPGDLLLAVNGTPVAQYSFNRVLSMLEGEKGTEVSLTFKRPQANIVYRVDLKREMIMSEENRVEVESVPFEDGVIGKIALHSFYKNSNGISSEKDVRTAIAELKEEGRLKGLVLDLRNNSGGYLSEAVKVAGLFITNGVIVISKYHDGEKHFYRDVDGKTYFDGPLVVLISRVTASAAEIVAQALQDYGVAVIVGDDRSYGKGSIQSQTVTGDEGSAYFKVTVGKYYTVSGRTPQVKGVIADVVVPGEYVYYEGLGEKKSKNSLLPDRIEPAYEDSLSDIKPEAKPWFFRYYLPTLQPKKTSWQKMIPELNARSRQRLHIAKGHGVSAKEQENEAVRVVQDMIKLHSKLNKDQVGAYE
jgi:carboxyl-terminal processing protease